jgi:glycosyltransferase involved in cell wall biosynthesis/Flp pilus assembly protein TadD
MDTADRYSPLAIFERNLKDGRNFLRNNEIAKAAECFERAYDIKSNEPELSFLLATLCQKLALPEKSERFFRKSVALNPYRFEYLYAYAMFLFGFSRFDDALAILHRCVKLQPDNAQLLNDLGVVYNEKQDFPSAIEFLTAASEKKPDYLVPLINLGHLYLRMNEFEKAEALSERLVKQRPSDKEVAELVKMLGESKKRTRERGAVVKTVLRFSDAEASIQIAPLLMIEQFGQRVSPDKIGLSIVVPVYNEEENIPVLFDELSAALITLKQDYEIIFIDDGSADKSREALAAIAAADKRVKVIFFRRNYGQTAALGAGFKYARGEVVVTLDADLQNDPADIPKLLAKMAEGYDLVNGWRKDRRDKVFSRKIPSMIANRIINKLIEGTNVQLRDFGCTLKAYKKGIVKNIHLYGEMHRFIPVFAAWIGVKVTEIPVNHRPRLHGEAKYNLSRVSRVIFDLIVVRFFSDYMTRPIQFFGKIAKKMTGWGIFVIAGLSVLGLLHLAPISLNTVLLLAALLFFSALQMLTMGLIGELMIRFYFEVQHKDYYVVESILNDQDAGRP